MSTKTDAAAATTKVVIKNVLPLNFILFITFLVLKLTKVIAWSWWFVTMPLWIGWAIAFSFMAVIFIVFIVLAVMAIIVAIVE